MSIIFDSLPGIEVPIASALSTLASMWDFEPAKGHAAPSEFRASQMNLVLHFGMDATPAFARAQFDTVLRFAQRYPCRTLILCPRQEESGEDLLRSKIFSECYIGKSRQEMSCCEVIILGYPQSQRAFLENQVSILLESDLPLYYWPSQIHSAARLSSYHFFLKEAKRVIFDSSVENEQMRTFTWPRGESVRDLVYARLLPVRQSIGQFLSSFSPAALAEGLQEVRVVCRPDCQAEGRVLLEWLKQKLADCRAAAGGEENAKEPDFSLEEKDGGKQALELTWSYGGKKTFSWSADFEERRSYFNADFGDGPTSVTLAARLLRPENAIAEALFF